MKIPRAFNWLDPRAGRWTQRDPLRFAEGSLQYLYAGANPLVMVDPDGRAAYNYVIGGVLFVVMCGFTYVIYCDSECEQYVKECTQWCLNRARWPHKNWGSRPEPSGICAPLMNPCVCEGERKGK